MNTPNWIKAYVSGGFEQKLRQTIDLAEKHSDVEFVPVVADRSSTIGHVFPLLTLMGMLVYVLLIEIAYHYCQSASLAWGASRYILFSLVLIMPLLISLLAWYVAKFKSVQRVLTSQFDEKQQVDMYAELEFFEHKLYQLPSVLIYVSLMERRSVILLSQDIKDKLSQNDIDDELRMFNQQLKLKKLEDGLTTLILNLATKLKSSKDSPKKNNLRKNKVNLKKRS